MKMHLEVSGQHMISHYGTDGITVGGQHFTGAVIVSESVLSDEWVPKPAMTLAIDDFEPWIAAATPEGTEDLPLEIILYGTGAKHRFLPPKLVAELSSRGVAIEAMTTRAACRTYSVLVGESRRVMAILLPVDAEEAS